MRKYRDTIQGNYAPLIQLQSVYHNAKSPIQHDFLVSLMELWKNSTNLHGLALAPPKNIWNVRIGVALAIMHEEYGILCLLSHLIKILKQGNGHEAVKTQFPNLDQFIGSFIFEFANVYDKSSKYFNILRMIPELGDHRSKIYSLPIGLDLFLRSIHSEGKSININELLQTPQEIKGIKLPTCVQAPPEANQMQKAHNTTTNLEKKETQLSVPKENQESTQKPAAFSLDQIICAEEKKQKVMPEQKINIAPSIPRKDYQEELKQKHQQDVQIKSSAPHVIQHAPNKSTESVDLLGIDDFLVTNTKKIEPKKEIIQIQNPVELKPAIKPSYPEKEEFKQTPIPIPVVAKQQNPMGHSKSAVQIIADELSNAQLSFLIDMNEVSMGKLIGMGASAEVFKGVFRGTEVAIKKMRQFSPADSAIVMKELKRELQTLYLLRHPNLVLFMGSGFTPQGNICIVTEFCGGGTIFKLLHESPKIALSWKQRIKISLDVAKGMNYLHSYKPPIIHRDLKSLNLLLAEPVSGTGDFVHTKITDFGLARFQSMDQLMTGSAGTFVIILR